MTTQQNDQPASEALQDYRYLDKETGEEVEMLPPTQDGLDPEPLPTGQSWQFSTPWVLPLTARVTAVRDALMPYTDADGETDESPIHYVTLETCRSDGESSHYPTEMTVAMHMGLPGLVQAAKGMPVGALVQIAVVPQDSTAWLELDALSGLPASMVGVDINSAVNSAE